MKKFVVVLVTIILMLSMTANAEIMERWIFDPRISVEVVDHVDENGCYSVYYSIAEEFVITLDRDVYNDTGWLSLYRGDINNCRLYLESDWGSKEESDKTINEWIGMALMMI